MNDPTKVIPGPAGHFYALLVDWQFGETLMGYPMPADVAEPPPHPSVDLEGWVEITDPAPGCDDAELVAELKDEPNAATPIGDPRWTGLGR